MLKIKPIFHIEDRGNCFIFHWFSYMVAGFRHLGSTNSLKGTDGSGSFYQNSENIDFNNLDLSFPLKVYIPTLPNPLISYQAETFDILKDKFQLVSKSDFSINDIVINNYGEYILNSDYHICSKAYEYLRELFLSRVKLRNNFKGKQYYVSRSKSHLLEGNASYSFIKRRHIFNDSEVIDFLGKFGIETIFLEDFSVEEKIQIFQEADLIISAGSGGLTFTLFCQPTITIVEIQTTFPSQISRQYQDQCRYLNVPYFKYVCDKYDSLDNMTINVEDFANFLIWNKILV